jgi:F-type H+-transporting ATPase subunit delta
MTITIESAIALTTEQQQEVEKLLAQKENKAEFVYKVNPDILGGLRVTMGGKRIDLSLASKLQHVQQSLA